MKRLAAVLPKNAANTVFVHEPRYVRYNNVALWSQGPVVPGLPRHPKVRARPLELRFFFFPLCVLVLISVKTGLYLGPWANMVIDLRVEIALHDIFLVMYAEMAA